jgi:hypothetical protein
MRVKGSISRTSSRSFASSCTSIPSSDRNHAITEYRRTRENISNIRASCSIKSSSLDRGSAICTILMYLPSSSTSSFLFCSSLIVFSTISWLSVVHNKISSRRLGSLSTFDSPIARNDSLICSAHTRLRGCCS